MEMANGLCEQIWAEIHRWIPDHQEFMMQESGQYMAAGQGYFGKSYNTHFIIQNGAALADSSAAYDSSSKDYRTDQTDPSDRSSDIDKGEAVWQIAQKILVAELFDLAMKLVHYISERNDQAGTAAKVTYEATKRLENYLVVRKTCEMAKDVYEGYVYWRETMDLIRECRDTYNSISAAWDGLSASALKSGFITNMEIEYWCYIFPMSGIVYRLFI